MKTVYYVLQLHPIGLYRWKRRQEDHEIVAESRSLRNFDSLRTKQAQQLAKIMHETDDLTGWVNELHHMKELSAGTNLHPFGFPISPNCLCCL